MRENTLFFKVLRELEKQEQQKRLLKKLKQKHFLHNFTLRQVFQILYLELI